jgi:predicted acetyltransferase
LEPTSHTGSLSAVPTSALRLRPLRSGDEQAALAAHAALAAEGFTFLHDYPPGRRWNEYVQFVDDQRCPGTVAADRVPATFLAAVDGDLVGRVSIRHRLDDYLAAYGGHIGYSVVPWQRHRGYATEMLRQAMIIARSVGVDDVLVTCLDDNVFSAKVIEACGGELESVIDEPGEDQPLRRYWIH